ncbi:MAG TPA: nuclear transport factor 2 family protein [Kofleriaceae bacterium]|nr:nuclear transport factor 2 family protein [Kofleriaceae bacterium]
MRTVSAVVVGLCVSGAGCKDGEVPGRAAETEPDHATAPGPERAVDAAPAPPPSEGATVEPGAPPPPTGIGVATWYLDCWDAFNDRDWTELRDCYADALESVGVSARGADAMLAHARELVAAFPDAQGEPRLTLVDGGHLAAVVHVTGTHRGSLRTASGHELAPTQQRIDLLVAHVVDLDPTGRVARQVLVFDSMSAMGQLGLLPAGVAYRRQVTRSLPPKTVVVAHDDATARRNLAVVQAAIDAFNRRDLVGLAASNAPEVVWTDVTAPADQTRPERIAAVAALLQGFPDLRLQPIQVWAAGEYVVTTGVMTGTNRRAVPALQLDGRGGTIRVPFVRIDDTDPGGEVDRGWWFVDRAAIATQLARTAPGPTPPPK